MALGDKVIVTYDAGGRDPKAETVRADSAGGSVEWEAEDGFVVVRERTKAGRAKRRLAFAASKVRTWRTCRTLSWEVIA